MYTAALPEIKGRVFYRRLEGTVSSANDGVPADSVAPPSGGVAAVVPRHEGWFTSTVAGVGLTSLFSDWSHELVTSLMPALLASLGAPPIALGLVEGLSDAASTAFKLAGGVHADRITNRKPLLLLGYALTAIKALLAVVTAWWQIVVLRMIAWAGRGLRNPIRDSLLADVTPTAAYGRAFGFHRGMDSLGAILGPLTASLLFPHLGMSRTLFVSLVPATLSVLALAALVRDVPHRAARSLRFTAGVSMLPTRFRWLVGSAGLFGLGNYAHTFLILYAVTVLTPTLGAVRASALSILLYTVHNAFYAAGSYPAGVLADRLGKRALLIGGYVLFAALNVLLLAGHAGVPVLVAAFVLAGIYIAMVDAAEGAFAAELLPAEVRGAGYGVLATVNGIGDLVSGIVVGGLWTLLSPAAGFVYAALMALAGTLLLRRVGPPAAR
jgi:MFS family permease